MCLFDAVWGLSPPVTVAKASSWVLEGFQDAPEGFRKGFSTGGRVSDKGFFILAKVLRAVWKAPLSDGRKG